MKRREFLKIPVAAVPLLVFPALAKDNNTLHGYSVENAEKFRRTLTDKVAIFVRQGATASDPLAQRAVIVWEATDRHGNKFNDYVETESFWYGCSPDVLSETAKETSVLIKEWIESHHSLSGFKCPSQFEIEKSIRLKLLG